MAGYIFIDREDEGGQMRSRMRRNMRMGGYRSYGGNTSMRDEYKRGYETGYRHGVEDWEDEDESYRRRRDSMGRYV